MRNPANRSWWQFFENGFAETNVKLKSKIAPLWGELYTVIYHILYTQPELPVMLPTPCLLEHKLLAILAIFRIALSRIVSFGFDM